MTTLQQIEEAEAEEIQKYNARERTDAEWGQDLAIEMKLQGFWGTELDRLPIMDQKRVETPGHYTCYFLARRRDWDRAGLLFAVGHDHEHEELRRAVRELIQTS